MILNRSILHRPVSVCIDHLEHGAGVLREFCHGFQVTISWYSHVFCFSGTKMSHLYCGKGANHHYGCLPASPDDKTTCISLDGDEDPNHCHAAISTLDELKEQERREYERRRPIRNSFLEKYAPQYPSTADKRTCRSFGFEIDKRQRDLPITYDQGSFDVSIQETQTSIDLELTLRPGKGVLPLSWLALNKELRAQICHLQDPVPCMNGKTRDFMGNGTYSVESAWAGGASP